jgi:hypothetical protein
LNAANWRASASAAYSPAGRAIDRNAAYKWQNGRSQAVSNDFIQVDLGAAMNFSRVTLDHAGSINDFPRAYRLDVSNDGQTWTTAHTGSGTQSLTTITLASRRTARYIRVVETGTTGSSWFSVNEVRVYND